jgi:leader peptidase (prepilin peptidase)/N-methyltransferase
MFVAALTLPSPLVFQRIVFGCAMIVLFFVDLEHHRLPNEITLPGIVVGFACSFFMPPGWISSLAGIVAGGGSLWLVGWLWFVIRHEEGMGFGDVKMLAMIGAFLGWEQMLATLFVSTILGSLIGIGLIAAKKGNLKTALPFGCFLALGAVLASVGGDRAVRWYLSSFHDAFRLRRHRTHRHRRRAGGRIWCLRSCVLRPPRAIPGCSANTSLRRRLSRLPCMRP